MVTKARKEKLERVLAARQQGVIVLEDVYDPHNAAAVIRSCDAFGIQRVMLIFVREKPFDPRQVGKLASSSANKWVDFEVFHSTESCLAQLHEEGYETIATVPGEGAESLYEARLDSPKLAVMLGNEHRGLSSAAIESASRRVSIPMRGMVESLNLSVTASIFLFEMTRQRSKRGELYPLTETVAARVAEDWLAKASSQSSLTSEDVRT